MKITIIYFIMKYAALASASASFWVGVFSGNGFLVFLGDFWNLAFKLSIVDIVLVEKTEDESEVTMVLVVEDMMWCVELGCVFVALSMLLSLIDLLEAFATRVMFCNCLYG